MQLSPIVMSNKLFNYSILSLLTVFVIFIFPVNLLYIHLLTRAYIRDNKHLLASFAHETIDLYTFLKTNTSNLYNTALELYNNRFDKESSKIKMCNKNNGEPLNNNMNLDNDDETKCQDNQLKSQDNQLKSQDNQLKSQDNEKNIQLEDENSKKND